jgi:hypothetical protein
MIAADDAAVCMLVYRSRQPVLQVWTRDGKRKLREEAVEVRNVMNLHDERRRLIPLRGGFFLSGQELVWISRDAGRPAWRFATRPSPRNPWFFDDLADRSFRAPRVLGDKLFVAAREGGVFVFDVKRLTGDAK